MALLAYNRKKQFLAPDIEGLIKQITGFEENDKNFREVARFAYSNVIHHNFATVDISSVQKSVEGIAEKFKVHGLSQRGRRFEELVHKYVSSNSSQHSQLNTQWHVMLLLLKLAHNPTSVSEEALKAKPEETAPSTPQEEINWAEFLQEGLEGFQNPLGESDEDDELWMSASEDEDLEPSPRVCLQYMPPFDSSCSYETQGYDGIPNPSSWGAKPPPPSKAEAMRRLIRKGAQSEQWLRNNAQHSWWKDVSYRSIPEGRKPEAHVCDTWEKLMISKYGRGSSPLSQTQVISEYKVIQEVLWMLQVSTDTSLFHLDNNGLFCVKPNLSLPSTVPGTLHLVLEGLCPYFDIITKFKRFEEELYEKELSDNPLPVTYKAYCTALFQELHKFSQQVIRLEAKLNKQEETMTLVSVIEELRQGLNIVQYLYDIHNRAVTEHVSCTPWLCATRLLSVLYEALLETSHETYLEASLNIFMQSFHVYLDIIDVWLSEGRLEDWRGEFLVIREGGNLEVMPYEEEMRKCGIPPVSLLSKLVRVVRDAGRTMEVVSQLNKLPQLRETVQNKGCLFKEFSENVYNEIKRLKETVHVKPTVSEEDSIYLSADNSSTCFDEKRDNSEDVGETCNLISDEQQPSPRKYNTFTNQGQSTEKRSGKPSYLATGNNNVLYDQMMATLLDNLLLTEALRFYVKAEVSDLQQNSEPAPSQKEERQSVSLVGLLSMHGVLERQLELVVTRHRIASRLVTQTLRSEHSLLQHFTVLRTVFFMEAGNLAQSFYSYLFKEIESGVWDDSLGLSVQLQLCVEELFPGFGNFFTVLVKNNKLKTNDVHHAIPAISLAYKMDWPVSIVFTQDMIDSYNQVFKFLLHLKYAFWTLHNIRLSDLSKSANTLRVRRLQVLKMWMYHSTNTLHSYFMGLVLRSFSTHLEQSILLAESIHVIIKAHIKFLDEVKVHCLQDKKTPVETFIMKLLRLCSSLADQWHREESGALTETELRNLEDKYKIAYRGLVHCLDVVTEETDDDNFLNELKSEISYSEPGL